jgi:hypothetical protein
MMSITIKRGPESSRHWSGDGEKGKILQSADYVALRGLIAYGWGNSEVEFQIRVGSFEELAMKMMAVDRVLAAKAFGRALSDGFDQP